jgi:hypothetical protein
MRTTVSHDSARTTGIALCALAAGLLLVVSGASSPARAAVVPTVGLGTADSFEVLAGSDITNVGNTVINNGDVGLYPGTSITGYPPAVINNGVIHDNDAQSQQAQADLTTAYLDAASRPSNAVIVGDTLGGLVLSPGVYTGNALDLASNATITLNGAANSVWIFQAASTLVTGSASTVAFTGGAGPCNVFWQVGTSGTLGAGSTFAGTVMALSSISVNAGATIDGRLLARNQAVTGITVTLNRPTDCAARSGSVASTPTAEQSAATAAATAGAAAAATAAATAGAAAAATAAAAAAAAAAASELAPTGVDAIPVLASAAALFVLGGALLLWTRSRRRAASARNVESPTNSGAAEPGARRSESSGARIE